MQIYRHVPLHVQLHIQTFIHRYFHICMYFFVSFINMIGSNQLYIYIYKFSYMSHMFIWTYFNLRVTLCKCYLPVNNFQATTRSSPRCSWCASLPLLAPPPLRRCHVFDHLEAKWSGPCSRAKTPTRNISTPFQIASNQGHFLMKCQSLCRFLGFHLGGPHPAPGPLPPQRLRHATDAGGGVHAGSAASAGAPRAADSDATAPGLERTWNSMENPLELGCFSWKISATIRYCLIDCLQMEIFQLGTSSYEREDFPANHDCQR